MANHVEYHTRNLPSAFAQGIPRVAPTNAMDLIPQNPNPVNPGSDNIQVYILFFLLILL